MNFLNNLGSQLYDIGEGIVKLPIETLGALTSGPSPTAASTLPVATPASPMAVSSAPQAPSLMNRISNAGNKTIHFLGSVSDAIDQMYPDHRGYHKLAPFGLMKKVMVPAGEAGHAISDIFSPRTPPYVAPQSVAPQATAQQPLVQPVAQVGAFPATPTPQASYELPNFEDSRFGLTTETPVKEKSKGKQEAEEGESEVGETEGEEYKPPNMEPDDEGLYYADDRGVLRRYWKDVRPVVAVDKDGTYYRNKDYITPHPDDPNYNLLGLPMSDFAAVPAGDFAQQEPEAEVLPPAPTGKGLTPNARPINTGIESIDSMNAETNRLNAETEEYLYPLGLEGLQAQRKAQAQRNPIMNALSGLGSEYLDSIAGRSSDEARALAAIKRDGKFLFTPEEARFLMGLEDVPMGPMGSVPFASHVWRGVNAAAEGLTLSNEDKARLALDRARRRNELIKSRLGVSTPPAGPIAPVATAPEPTAPAVGPTDFSILLDDDTPDGLPIDAEATDTIVPVGPDGMPLDSPATESVVPVDQLDPDALVNEAAKAISEGGTSEKVKEIAEKLGEINPAAEEYLIRRINEENPTPLVGEGVSSATITANTMPTGSGVSGPVRADSRSPETQERQRDADRLREIRDRLQVIKDQLESNRITLDEVREQHNDLMAQSENANLVREALRDTGYGDSKPNIPADTRGALAKLDEEISSTQELIQSYEGSGMSNPITAETDTTGEGISDRVSVDTTDSVSAMSPMGLEVDTRQVEPIPDVFDPTGGFIASPVPIPPRGVSMEVDEDGNAVYRRYDQDMMPIDVPPYTQPVFSETPVFADNPLGPPTQSEYESEVEAMRQMSPTDEELDFDEEFVRRRAENPIISPWELRRQMEQERDFTELDDILEDRQLPPLPQSQASGSVMDDISAENVVRMITTGGVMKGIDMLNKDIQSFDPKMGRALNERLRIAGNKKQLNDLIDEIQSTMDFGENKASNVPKSASDKKRLAKAKKLADRRIGEIGKMNKVRKFTEPQMYRLKTYLADNPAIKKQVTQTLGRLAGPVGYGILLYDILDISGVFEEGEGGLGPKGSWNYTPEDPLMYQGVFGGA